MTRPSKKLSKQLSKGQDGLGNNKKRGLITEDLQKLVEAHNNLATVSQKELDGIGKRLDDMTVTLQAIANVVGMDKVREESKKIRIQLLEDESAEMGKNVEKAYGEGKLMKIFEVTDKCLVVASIFNPDGTQTHPFKNYLTFATIKPEVQALLLGKKIGETLQLPTESGTIQILESYEECVPATSGYIAPVDPVLEGQIREAEFVVPATNESTGAA
jgi:hypothetical protein